MSPVRRIIVGAELTLDTGVSRGQRTVEDVISLLTGERGILARHDVKFESDERDAVVKRDCLTIHVHLV